MNALRFESRNEEVDKEMNAWACKACILLGKKRKNISHETAVRAAGKALLTVLSFAVTSLHLWFSLICSALSLSLCYSLDFNSIQYFLLPFGCHLDHRNSLSKRNTPAKREMTGSVKLPCPPPQQLCWDPVICWQEPLSHYWDSHSLPLQSTERMPKLVSFFKKILSFC